MNRLSFNRANVLDRKSLLVHCLYMNRIDKSLPLHVESKITGRVVSFVYDDVTTRTENELNEGWDGEEWHLFFTDTEGKGIKLNVWDSPNFH